MKRLILTLISLIAMGGIFSSHAALYRQNEAMKQRASLKNLKTTADSIPVLYNIFDLEDKKDRTDVAWKLLEIGRRTGNDEIVFDILPHLAVLEVKNDVALDSLLKIVETLPDGNKKKGVKLFINVERTTNEARYLSPEERHKALLEYAKEDMTPKYDLFEDILDLYRVVIFIRHTAKGSMYLEYLSRLEEMINQLPEESKYLRNLFYTTAANYYTNNNYPEKAVEVDHKLLGIIDELRDHYQKVGRIYRTLYANEYICYRRMLRNYRALDLDEVKELHAKCAMLAEKDEEIRESFYLDQRPTAYRLMAEKDYKGAIPYLKKSLEVVDDENVRQWLLYMVVEAADSVGDQMELLDALKEYNHMLVNKMNQRTEEAVLELQIRYDVNKLKSEKSKLELQKKNIELSTNQKVISVTLVALFLLVIALMFLYRSHFRLLRKTRDLNEENERLRKSVDEILDDGIPSGSKDLKSYKAEDDGKKTS